MHNLRDMAADMALELNNTFLEVIMVPAPVSKHCGHHVRRAVNQNPEWYRQLCMAVVSSAHPRRSRFDTAIKRQHVLAALLRIAAGKSSGYHTDLIIAAIHHQITLTQEAV